MAGRVSAVTGATGFVGANLVRRLLADGDDVHILVRAGHEAWRLHARPSIARSVTVHTVDITDAAAVASLMRAIRPRRTFHLAAHGAYSWQNDADRITRINVDGTRNVVRASIDAGVESVVTAGSSSEYGFCDHAPREDEALRPNSEYAVTKAAATHLAQLLSLRSGVPVTTLRLYSVYGPFEHPDRLIPCVIRHGLSGGLPPLADPGTARDFVHVDDASAAFVLAADRVTDPAVVLNVATGRQTTLAEVADLAVRRFGLDAEPQWGTLDPRAWDTHCWVGDATALRQLGWRPKVAFEHGFTATAQWWAETWRRESSRGEPLGAGAAR